MSVGKDGPRFFCLWTRNPNHHDSRPEEKPDDQSVTEDAADGSTTEDGTQAMSEVDPVEEETGKKMWLSEKVTSLEKENGELKRALQEMEAKIELQGKMIAEMSQRHGAIEITIAQIAERVQRQDSFDEGVRASFTVWWRRLESTKTTSEKWCESSKPTRSTWQRLVQRRKRWRNTSTRSSGKTRTRRCGSAHW